MSVEQSAGAAGVSELFQLLRDGAPRTRAELAKSTGLARSTVAARVDEVAAFWLDNATAAYGQAKRLVRVGAHRTFAENLDDEAASIGARFDTDEAKVRVAAFAAASAKSRP